MTTTTPPTSNPSPAFAMDSSSDKDWASKELLAPLTAPEPYSEDGPGGSHFGNTFGTSSDKRSGAQIKADKKEHTSVRSAKAGYPTPPASASPSRSAFPEYREEGFTSRDALLGSGSPRQSSEIPTSTVPSATASLVGDRTGDTMPRRRGSSLGARFPGDKSHRPLDILRAEQKAASRHTRRTSKVGPDTIDKLDALGLGGVPYHHDGPYDATLMGRNLKAKYSPLAATASTNAEAIRATPQEFLSDAIRGHRPLAGVATVPPGVPDRYGRVLEYKEGPNLNVEMGWRRWQGIDYHPDDIKGKGEPNFTIDRALKEHKNAHRRYVSEGGIELAERPRVRASSNPFAQSRSNRPRTTSGADADADADADDEMSEQRELAYSEWEESGLRRANTTGKRTSGMAGALKNRFGSLRRRKPVEIKADEQD